MAGGDHDVVVAESPNPSVSCWLTEGWAIAASEAFVSFASRPHEGADSR
jgi:hypothetical protein